MFTSRKEYLDIIHDIEKKLYSKFKLNGKINDWFLLRVNLGFFFHLIYGNISTINQDFKTDNKKRKTIIFYSKRTIKIIYLFFKIQYLKLILKNKLNNKNLYLGYHKHSKNDFNIYINPFADDDKEAVLFHYDYRNNSILWQRFFTYLEQYYSLLNNKIDNTNTQYNTELIIEFLKTQYDINSNYLDKYLKSSLSSSKKRYKIFYVFLKTLQPKQVFVYSYYDSYANNALLAANVLKIKTIEYQHSSISDSHFAYAKWNNLSKIANHFPKTFFLWDKESKDLVSKNFSDNYTSQIITGNKYLSTQIGAKENLKNSGDPRNILICLQGIWIPEFLESFILEDKFYNWYIRLHPRYPQDKIKLDNLLILKTDGIYYEEANNIDLYKLFEKVSIVMTSFSGVALEAESFNKQIIIFGEDGFNTYKSKIEEKKYNFVENYESLHAVLNGSN